MPSKHLVQYKNIQQKPPKCTLLVIDTFQILFKVAVVFSSIGLLHKIIPIHPLRPLNWNGFQHQWWVCFSLCKSKAKQPKKKTLGFYRPEEFMGLWDESRCNWAIRSDRENEGVDWNRSLFAFLAKVYYCHVLLQHCRQHFKLWAKVVFQ